MDDCNDFQSAASSVDSEEESRPNQIDVRLYLVGELATDQAVLTASRTFGVPVDTIESGEHLLNLPNTDRSTVIVVKDCVAPYSHVSHKEHIRILGRTALLEMAERGLGLQKKGRPLYSYAMHGLVVCFTGFRKKDQLTRVVKLVQNMGGSIRKDMSSKVTHLIAHYCRGEKYQYAMTFRVPVMSEEWVTSAWANRTTVGFSAAAPEFLVPLKLKPFFGARVCFVGFTESEKNHMEDILADNGGIVAEISDCTHVIMDDLQTCILPPNACPDAFVVRAEWFWVSVQNEGCAVEEDYRIEECPGNANTSRESLSTPTCSRVRKRKRLRDPGSLILPESRAVQKRRSSVSDANLLNMSGSFLDSPTISEKPPADEVESAALKTLSPRHQVFLELVQTETNYVGILDTIMTLIKAPLEEMTEKDGPLLDNTELKTIFGNLPPIYHLHSRMLQELCWTSTHWTESTCTGNIILKYASEMVKAYPPFCNFFEQTKEMVQRCDETKPRFHAFLKVCQGKPECGRQTLGDLLIRPIQRLPSIELLLGDILKHTSKSNPDHSALESARTAIKEVLTLINEDKRRIGTCIDMFKYFNKIDNCPPHLVSSHRAFVSQCDVVELSNELSGRGDSLVFFLFSDILEVCKKRKAGGTSLKSPNTAAFRSSKDFKHFRLLPLSDIKRVFDVQDSHGECEESANMFALKCRSNQELKEKLYVLALDDKVDKMAFLQTLCRQLANTVCKADAAYFLATMEYHEVGINASDAGFGTLGKAFRLASKTKLLKLGRTFSFNKTPSKLKRAVSTMMSPFGSSTNLTPASQLSQMRLASCTNLKDFDDPPSDSGTLRAPSSVQPRRKNTKATSLNTASFRRL